jgi:hypothetical protein
MLSEHAPSLRGKREVKHLVFQTKCVAAETNLHGYAVF